MTNPIMPGIEKLAEKYGIKVNNPNLSSNDDFKIIETDFEYIINNIELNNKKETIEITKDLLDDGKSYSSDTWLNLVNHDIRKNGDDIIYDIPSLPMYLGIIHTLYKNKDGIYKDQINSLKNNLIRDFSNGPIITSTVVRSSALVYESITHESNTLREYIQSFDLKNLKSNLNVKKLTGLNKNSLKQSTAWFSNDDSIYFNFIKSFKDNKSIIALSFSNRLNAININEHQFSCSKGAKILKQEDIQRIINIRGGRGF